MRAFGISADSGITPLPFGEDHGLCVKCEGRPAFVDVRRPADLAARRLCFQCAVLERMERKWKLLTAPPEVATALERCRRL